MVQLGTTIQRRYRCNECGAVIQGPADGDFCTPGCPEHPKYLASRRGTYTTEKRTRTLTVTYTEWHPTDE